MYSKRYPSLYHDVREEGRRGEGSGSCELIAGEEGVVGGWVVCSRSTVSFPQARGGSLVCGGVGQRVQSHSNRVKAELYYV